MSYNLDVLDKGTRSQNKNIYTHCPTKLSIPYLSCGRITILNNLLRSKMAKNCKYHKTWNNRSDINFIKFQKHMAKIVEKIKEDGAFYQSKSKSLKIYDYYGQKRILLTTEILNLDYKNKINLVMVNKV